MSRVDELNRVILEVAEGYANDNLDSLGVILNMLEEIAVSLAVIADNSNKKVEHDLGAWINRERNGKKYPFWDRYECSECRHHGKGIEKHCPNCGAKMIER